MNKNKNKTSLQKLTNKTGLQGMPAKKSFNKLVGKPGASNVKPGDATQLSYFYYPKGWTGNVNEHKTDSATHQGRPGAPQAKAQKKASAEMNNATHASYQDKLNQQLAEFEAKSQARQKAFNDNMDKALEKYRNDIGEVQKNLSEKFPGIGKVSHNNDEGGGGDSGLPQLPD